MEGMWVSLNSLSCGTRGMRGERTGNCHSTWAAEVMVGRWAGANDKAEEETRLADTRLADDEELEEQVRSGGGGESGKGAART